MGSEQAGIRDMGDSSRVSNPGTDRISNLPDALKCRILSFVGTKDAVSTSLLSKGWRHTWMDVDTLDFEEGEYDRDDDDRHKRMNFVQFVNKVLLAHRAPELRRFRLSGHIVEFHGEAVYVSSWIRYAITRKIGHLDLHLEMDVQDCDMPGSLFTCATLHNLTLSGYFKVRIPATVHLPKLEVMSVNTYSFDSDESLNRLISGSPNLHSLSIQSISSRVRTFAISSPSLKSFVIRKGTLLSRVKLQLHAPGIRNLAFDQISLDECFSMSSLVSVDSVLLDLAVAQCSVVVKVMEAVKNVRFLTLKGTVMESLTYATSPLSARFDRLTNLDIHIRCCYWTSLALVLASSVNLENLSIAKTGCQKTTHRPCWRDPKDVPRCVSSSLASISYKGFAGLADELSLIKYMLKHGAMMRSVEIQSDAHLASLKKRFIMLQKISMLTRLSEDCSIKFA